MGERRQLGSRLRPLLRDVVVLFAISLTVNADAQSVSNHRIIDIANHVPIIKEGYVTIDGLRLRYVESGSGSPIVLIHGNPGSIEDFEFGVIDALSSSYHILAIDRPGHGRSDRPTGNTADAEYQARLLHRVLLSLDVARPVLVGHSWGAALALAYELQYPTEVSALILVAPAAYPDVGESRLLQAMNKPPVIGDVTLMLGHSILGKQILKGALKRAFAPQPLPERYFRFVASSWLGRKQLKAYIDDESSLTTSLNKLTKRYSDISVPVVIVTGDHDQMVSPTANAYRLKDSIANSRLIELRDAGHEIPQTHPESIGRALKLIRLPTLAMMH